MADTMYYVKVVHEGETYVVPFGDDKAWVDEHRESVLKFLEPYKGEWHEMPDHDGYYDDTPADAVINSLYLAIKMRPEDF